jgi:hypothetical protein
MAVFRDVAQGTLVYIDRYLGRLTASIMREMKLMMETASSKVL